MAIPHAAYADKDGNQPIIEYHMGDVVAYEMTHEQNNPKIVSWDEFRQ